MFIRLLSTIWKIFWNFILTRSHGITSENLFFTLLYMDVLPYLGFVYDTSATRGRSRCECLKNSIHDCFTTIRHLLNIVYLFQLFESLRYHMEIQDFTNPPQVKFYTKTSKFYTQFSYKSKFQCPPRKLFL